LCLAILAASRQNRSRLAKLTLLVQPRAFALLLLRAHFPA